MKDKVAFRAIGVLSVVIPLAVAFLLFMPKFFKLSDNDFSSLPHLNAVLNSSTAICLLLALYFVKQGNHKLHQMFMTTGLIFSTLFLVSYVIYHSQAEHTLFGGEGVIKAIYLTVLLSHIALSVVVIPFVLLAFYFALKGQFDKHKKIVKYGYPLWLYVAISGVTVYFMIRPYYPI